MRDINQSEDIMGIGQQDVFQPYVTEDGWTVVTPGAESGRRQAQGKKVYAWSQVEVQLHSKEDLDVCIAHLKESDRRFEKSMGLVDSIVQGQYCSIWR